MKKLLYTFQTIGWVPDAEFIREAENTSLPSCGGCFALTIMAVRLRHPAKALSPINITISSLDENSTA